MDGQTKTRMDSDRYGETADRQTDDIDCKSKSKKKKRKEIARRGAPKRLDGVFGTRVRLEMFSGRHLYRRRCRRCGRRRRPARAATGVSPPIEGGDYYAGCARTAFHHRRRLLRPRCCAAAAAVAVADEADGRTVVGARTRRRGRPRVAGGEGSSCHYHAAAPPASP